MLWSDQARKILFKEYANTRMTTARQYDFLNRLQSIRSTPSAAGELPVAFTYLHNDANQRIQTTLADGGCWVYQYDRLGQVTSGKRYWSDGSPVPGQQFDYGFDDIGNRTTATWGGDTLGAGLRSANYTATLTNTYSSRTVPGGFDVLGIANAAASVTVNSSPADYRRGEYFQEALSVNNGSGSVWQAVNVTAVNGGSSSNWPAGSVFVPPAAEGYTYDADGNMTEDGRWAYTWDGENRLIRLVAKVAAGPHQRLDFAYDAQGRRISKRVWPNTGGTGTLTSDLLFVYDGWNLVAELNATNKNVIRGYFWGLDLSGSEQAAGGVGGLLAIRPAGGAAHFAAFDGNGNVAALVDSSTGTASASYEYGPFAESVRANVVAARVNPFRFSTKYTDDETDLLYYGHRFYSPSTGRWPSRDSIEELRGLHLYAFAANNPVNLIDPLGQDFIAVAGRPVKGIVPGNHYSLQYWVTCSEGPAQEMEISEWEHRLSKTAYSAKKRSGVELQISWPWTVTLAATGVRVPTQVSYIHRKETGKRFVSVYEGDRKDVLAKWKEIALAAEKYEFAEHPFNDEAGFTGPFLNWPDSKYGIPAKDPPVNNSNTFVREVLKRVGITMKELSGSFPGNTEPIHVPNRYNGVPVRN